LDSISSSLAPSILVVEDDAQAREPITRALTQAGYEAVPGSSGDDALDLMAAAEFDGLYCVIELSGRTDSWEVGSTFSFICPDRLVVYASAIAAPPGPLRKGVFLRKPFMVAMLARAFGPARTKGTVCSGSAAQAKPENLTATRIKPAASFVYLT
jgi:DNA-binding NtrC family response regulator